MERRDRGGLIAKEYHMAPPGRHMVKDSTEGKRWQRFRARVRFNRLSRQEEAEPDDQRTRQSDHIY